MESKQIVGGVVGLAVAVILVATLLVPIIDDNDGEQTFYNDGAQHNTYREIKEGDSLSATRTIISSNNSDVWELNGEKITNTLDQTSIWDIGIASDGIYLQISSASSGNAGVWYKMTDGAPVANYLNQGNILTEGQSIIYRWTFSADTLTFTRQIINADGTPTSDPYTIYTASWTWGYIVCNRGEDATLYSAAVSTGEAIVNDERSTVLCGAYSTGDLDTMYYRLANENLTLLNSAYTGTVDYTLTEQKGFTDLFTEKVTVNVSDGSTTESFNPFRVLVPYEVIGHTESYSKTTYSLLHVIPVLVLVGLVVGAVGVFIRARAD